MLNVAAWEDKACKLHEPSLVTVCSLGAPPMRQNPACQITKQWCKFDNAPWHAPIASIVLKPVGFGMFFVAVLVALPGTVPCSTLTHLHTVLFTSSWGCAVSRSSEFVFRADVIDFKLLSA